MAQGIDSHKSIRLENVPRISSPSPVFPLLAAEDLSDSVALLGNRTLFLQDLQPQLMGNKSVNPASADVGEQLEFSIAIQNIGTAPAELIEITDIFTDTLKVNNVTTTKGNAYFENNKVLVKINSLNVSQKANISIFVTVNETGGVITTLYNTAHFTYHFGDKLFKGSTNSVIFQTGATAYPLLPFTGGMEKDTSSLGKFSMLLFVGILLAILGISILVFSFWDKSSHPGARVSFQGFSVVMVVLGISISVGACTQADTRSDQQIEPTLAETAVIPVLKSVVPTQIDTIAPALIPTFTPGALPDYLIPTPTILAGADSQGIAFDISPIQRIAIPSLGLDTVVKYVPFDGTSWKIDGLTSEVVWMGETSWPGLGGNTGLSAHVSLPDGSDGPFRYLSELKEGDIVEIYTDINRYIYEVRTQQVVADSELSVLTPTDHSQITLITCTDWNMALERYLSRLVVYSDLLDIQPLEITSSFY